MMNRSHFKVNSGAYIIIICSVIAFLLTLNRFITPLSGITGTGAAIVTMSALAVLCLLGLFLLCPSFKKFRNIILLLLVIGVIGTIFAGLLIHGAMTVVLLIICAIGILIEIFKKKGEL